MTCPICYYEKDLYELECSHEYCEDCLVNYIDDKINDSEYEIKCPKTYCNYVIPYNMIENLTKSNLNIIKKLDKNILKNAVYSSENLKFCPKCENVCEKEYSNMINCDNCNYQFCYNCGLQYGDDHNCEYVTLEELENALIFEDDDRYKKLKHCPKCDFINHKYNGCDCVKCPNCKCKYCWNCLTLVDYIFNEDEHKNNCTNYIRFDEND